MRCNLIITSHGKAIRRRLSALDKFIVDKSRKEIMEEEDANILEKLKVLDLFVKLIDMDNDKR